MHPYVHCSINYNSQDMEATSVSIDKLMDKEEVYMCVCVCTHIHTYNGILCSNEKEWNLAICNNMDGPRWYYAKWNKSHRER